MAFRRLRHRQTVALLLDEQALGIISLSRHISDEISLPFSAVKATPTSVRGQACVYVVRLVSDIFFRSSSSSSSSRRAQQMWTQNPTRSRKVQQ
jgi:hypothetical protein